MEKRYGEVMTSIDKANERMDKRVDEFMAALDKSIHRVESQTAEIRSDMKELDKHIRADMKEWDKYIRGISMTTTLRRNDMSEPEITLKNTKAEILDALNAALARAESAEKGRLNTEKQEREKTEKRVIASAEKSMEQDIFSRELIQKFKDLQSAIEMEGNRLQELYGVGKELQKLALAIEAGNERIAEIEKEKAGKEEAAQSGLKKLRDEFTQKQAELQAEYDAQAKKLKTDRDREAEEFKYNLTRSREKENNAWADAKAARESDLQKREARAAELLADAESKVEYIRSLEEKVKAIPETVGAERESAVAAVTEKLNREHSHQSELLEMERKGAIARLEDRVKYLEKELAASVKTVETLQGKLDKSYSEMRDLAAKTVESAGNIKFIGGTEKIN